MNSKSILTIFSALLVTTFTAMAQEPVGNKATVNYELQDNLVYVEGQTFAPGDTIIIKKDQPVYLTGEQVSEWVYYVKHTIYSVGGKRFPEGVLVNGIMSWVGKQDLYNMNNAGQQQAEEKPAEQQPAESAKPAAKAEQKQQPVEEEQPVEEAQPTEEQQPVEEQAPGTEEQVVEQQPAEEQQPVEETQPAAEEQITQQPEDGFVLSGEAKPQKGSYDRLTIGLHGGAGSFLHTAPAIGNGKVGYSAMLDLQYAHYWESYKKNAYGILIGVSAGYVENGLKGAVDSAYQVVSEGQHIDYTINTEQVKENDGAIQLEVPIMFSMILDKGFYLNIGPKIALPVYNHYRQNLTNPDITAVFTDMGGVVVKNEAITGLVSDNQMKSKGKWNAGTLSVRLALDLGYEWKLSRERSVSLGAYGTYGVYTLRNSDGNAASMIDVAPPTSGSVAQVTVNSASDVYATGIGYFDAGIKVAYHFNLNRK